MKILGREVTARRYGNKPLINAYVSLKEGDCRRDQNPGYACLDNCERRLITARFLQGQLFSVKAIAPEEMRVREDFVARTKAYRTAQEFFEGMSEQPGLEIQIEGPKQLLKRGDEMVAYLVPCGYAKNESLWLPETRQIVKQLCERFPEIESIAEDVPLFSLVEDRALASQILNPALESLMAQFFGAEGLRELRMLRAAHVAKN